MKVLILKQNVTDQLTLDRGLEIVRIKCASVGLPIDFVQMNFINLLKSLPFSNSTNKDGHYVDPSSFLGAWNIGYDNVCLIYDWTKVTPQPTNPADNGGAMQIPIQWFEPSQAVPPEQVFAEFFLHELCHYFFNKTGKPDITHIYDPAFSQETSRIPWYLFLLKGMVSTQSVISLPVYKHFNASEVVGLKPELVKLLDGAREIAGVPFIITSGRRTIAQNASVGGVAQSTHLLGEGADISCNDTTRWVIIFAGYKAGFKRIEVCPNHIHFDIGQSPQYPQNWLGVSIND